MSDLNMRTIAVMVATLVVSIVGPVACGIQQVYYSRRAERRRKEFDESHRQRMASLDRMIDGRQ
jgi:hypothetical protein